LSQTIKPYHIINTDNVRK